LQQFAAAPALKTKLQDAATAAAAVEAGKAAADLTCRQKF
jgi:hypothetical protein